MMPSTSSGLSYNNIDKGEQYVKLTIGDELFTFFDFVDFIIIIFVFLWWFTNHGYWLGIIGSNRATYEKEKSVVFWNFDKEKMGLVSVKVWKG